MADEAVCIPLLLDAYCMTKQSFEGPSKIAPITQPNYTSLRLDSNYIQHDLQNPIDFHRVSPAAVNSRVADISQPVVDLKNPSNLRSNRFGINLHWSLPHLYRTAATSAQGTEADPKNPNPDASIGFRRVPNRWLLIRNLKEQKPATANAPKLKAWIIESDALRSLGDDDMTDDVDLETDVTPFVHYVPGDETKSEALQRQTEVFIGRKTDLSSRDWSEPGPSKVALTGFNSSNPLFADYVVHNSNVFSTIDDLSFTPKNPGDPSHLTSATCDYLILGWHSEDSQGPLFGGPLAAKGDLAARLDTLRCTYSGLDSTTLNDASNRRVLTHGAVYNVVYNYDGPKAQTPADESAVNFDDFDPKNPNTVKMEPLSIGTTPLDAVLTFIKAHKLDAEKILDAGDGTPSGDPNLAARILSLSQLMYAAEESYSGRVRAEDLLLNANYSTTTGGDEWLFDELAKSGGAPMSPSVTKVSGRSQVDYLSDLDEYQRLLDCAKKKLSALQWSLFAEWFKFVSDAAITDNTLSKDPTRLDPYVNKVMEFIPQIRALQALIGNDDPREDTTGPGLLRKINIAPPDDDNQGRSPKVPARKATLPTFFSRKEPSMCIAGVDSGYPAIYKDKIPIRIDLKSKSQIPDASTSLTLDGRMTKALKGANLLSVAQRLFNEAFSDSGPPKVDSVGFNLWTKQPFRPLFIEWTAQYYHVPFDNFGIRLLSSPLGNNHTQARYVIEKQIDATVQDDSRLISGRCLILPQPAFSLKTALASLFDNTPPKLLPDEFQYTDEGKKNRENLLKQVDEFKFVAAPLSGLTDALLTRVQGAHVKPNIRKLDGKNTSDGGQVISLRAAVDAVQKLNQKITDPNLRLDNKGLALIDASSAVTPLGNLIDFSPALKNPFKPVTHGQMMITKLNIVDKFGQAICVPEPKPRTRKPQLPRPVHPCLADTVCPNTVDTGDPKNPKKSLNVVMDFGKLNETGQPLCPFMQLTPSINQDARINAEFMIREVDAQGAFRGWRVAQNWENPIFGWIIINYADLGLQFFLPDGTFYVEIRFGGPLGKVDGLKWLPFNPPQQPKILSNPDGVADTLVNPQLVELVNKIMDRKDEGGINYFANFWATIESAIKTMPYPPSDYSQFANAVVGKPLALVNTGWSLELAEPPMKLSHTISSREKEISSSPTKDALTSGAYTFPIKLGDNDRPFDGVVAYWDNEGHDDQQSTGVTLWDTVYRYQDTDSTANAMNRLDKRFVDIDTTNYPRLTPYYVHPDKVPYSRNDHELEDSYPTFTAAHTAQLRVKTMLLDPYLSIHGFSPILPIKEFRLQPWQIQAAFRKMTAFFITGPVLLTKNPQPLYNEKAPLEGDSWLQDQQTAKEGDDKDPKNKAVKLPIKGRKGFWRWLQPYANGVDEKGSPALRYNALQVEEEDGSFRAEQGPYTMVEGFLQLAKPLIKEDTPDMS